MWHRQHANGRALGGAGEVPAPGTGRARVSSVYREIQHRSLPSQPSRLKWGKRDMQIAASRPCRRDWECTHQTHSSGWLNTLSDGKIGAGQAGQVSALVI